LFRPTLGEALGLLNCVQKFWFRDKRELALQFS
jgi:hypothetical protein